MRELINKGVTSESLVIAKCDSECASRVETLKNEIKRLRAADKQDSDTKYSQLTKAWSGISLLNEKILKEIAKWEARVKQLDTNVSELSQKLNEGTLEDLVKQVNNITTKATLNEQKLTNLATKATKN